MYLVWNESITESEFFGVTKSREKAKKLLNKIRKERYPNMSKDEIEEYEVLEGESTKITWFENQI